MHPHSPIFLFFLTASLHAHLVLGNLLYECRDFTPKSPTNCGTNTWPAHQWTIHATQSLPAISTNVVDILYVLYLNDTGSQPASFRLNGPSGSQLTSANRLCIQYAIIASNGCQNTGGSVCAVNVTLLTEMGLSYRPELAFTYDDQGWSVANYQFDLTIMSAKRKQSLDVVLHGYITESTNGAPSAGQTDPAYVGIKFIQIQNGTCATRIGPRKSFWITVLVLFSLVTGYTFIHIAIQHMMAEHRKRAKG